MKSDLDLEKCSKSNVHERKSTVSTAPSHKDPLTIPRQRIKALYWKAEERQWEDPERERESSLRQKKNSTNSLKNCAATSLIQGGNKGSSVFKNKKMDFKFWGLSHSSINSWISHRQSHADPLFLCLEKKGKKGKSEKPRNRNPICYSVCFYISIWKTTDIPQDFCRVILLLLNTTIMFLQS